MKHWTKSSAHTFNLVLAALLAGGGIASAHPGHELHSAPMSHLLTSPWHLACLTLLGLGLMLGAASVQRLAARRTLQVSGGIALAIVAATATLHLMG